MSKFSLRVALIAIVTILVFGVTGAYVFWKKDQVHIEQLYIYQNAAFQMDIDGRFGQGYGVYVRNPKFWRYLPYDRVNETRLIIALSQYTNDTGVSLDIDKIESYLSQELSIDNTPIEIQNYIDWFSNTHYDRGESSGSAQIIRYAESLNCLYHECIYYEQVNRGLPYYAEDLSTSQINELIKLYQLDEQQIESVISTHDGSQYGIDLSVFGIVRN